MLEYGMAFLESDLQKHVIVTLRSKGYQVHGDQSGQFQASYKQRAKSKLTGQLPGFPDLSIFLDSGRCLFIELKRKGNGLTDSQKDLHPKLLDLGHMLHTVTAETPQQASDMVIKILTGINHTPPKFDPLPDF